MKLKIAFAGFRHGHIKSLYEMARKHPELKIVAACEEDQPGAGSILEGIELTHDNFEHMLKSTVCDIVAIGDYYGKRGFLLVRSLQAGKHVILDKPICTSLTELDQAEKLACEKGLKIGCQLDLRQQPNLVRARQLIQSGQLGEIVSISFGGQHPLMLDSRPKWYFENGKHGGTINDIAIHGIDIIEWITGLKFVKVNAARNWNAIAKGCKFFKDAGQLMLTMENGCGVLGDVSYIAPNSSGYSLPYYWNFMFWGAAGLIRANLKDASVELARDGDKGISYISPPAKMPPDYLDQFLLDIKGAPSELNTAVVLNISRKTLKIQEAADKAMTDVMLT